MKHVWDVDSYFKIVSTPTGVFLTVYPPVGDGLSISVDDIITELEKKGVQNINYDAVKQAVEKQDGMSVRVGEYIEGEDEMDELLVIDISDDGLSAYLTILVPLHGGKEVTMEEILRKLKQKGVVFGINEDTIFDMLKHKRFNEEVKIASGALPVPGKDATLEFKFPLTQGTPKLKELKDGRVDFKNLDLIPSVRKGELLVLKKPATKGIPGMTVTGEKIPTTDGKDIFIPAGKNTTLSPDGLELRAEVAGKVYMNSRGKVEVDPVHIVRGNVDYSTGNIDFHGELIIEGSVMDGFVVRADKDITIRGNVWKATVVSEGNVTIKGGILGKKVGYVFAGKNVVAKFAEYCKIRARKDVIIGESIIYSYVDASGKVMLTGRRGVIMGGRIRAGEEISAKVVGSKIDTPTVLEVGVEPKVREEIKKLSNQIKMEKRKFQRIKLEIKGLLALKEKLGDKFPPEKEELLAAHLMAQNLLMEKLRDASEGISRTYQELSTSPAGRILVSGIIYPGVRVTIRIITMYIQEEYKYVCFSVKGNKIEVIPYDIGVTPQKRKRRI